MSWTNPSQRLFHGTDTKSLAVAGLRAGVIVHTFKISLAQCRPNTDFGQGFYLTTSEDQARDWANTRVRQAGRLARGRGIGTQAVVLSYDVSRDAMAPLETMAFARATDDYHAFVDHCRTHTSGPRHGRAGPRDAYDIVIGPVRLWPQRLVIFDADQISFNTPAAIDVLPNPFAVDVAIDPSGLF